MASATANRVATKQLARNPHSLPVKASEVLIAGCIVMMDSSGRALNGAAALGCFGVGVARTNHRYGADDGKWDATGLADAAIKVELDEGVFGPFVNSSSLIVAGDEGKLCWIVDNQTVSATGAGARSPAGRIYRVATEGVYVEMGLSIGRSIAEDARIIADPGNAGAIPITASGVVNFVSAGAETRTLAAPSFNGQTLLLNCDTDGGDNVITVAAAFNVAGNTTITLNDAGDNVFLIAATIGGTLRWRLVSNNGATLG